MCGRAKTSTHTHTHTVTGVLPAVCWPSRRRCWPPEGRLCRSPLLASPPPAKTKANSVSELLEQRAALLSDKINQIKARSVTFRIFISHLTANPSLFPKHFSGLSAFIRLEMSLGQAAPAGAGQFSSPVVRGCFFGTAPLQRSRVPLVHLISPQGLCREEKKKKKKACSEDQAFSSQLPHAASPSRELQLKKNLQM